MGQHIGEWVYGDTGTGILYTINPEDGSTPDYSTASAISLVATCSRPERSFTLTGSVSNGPSRIFSFASPGGTADDPGHNKTDRYTFRVTWTYNAKVHWTRKPQSLSIVRFP